MKINFFAPWQIPDGIYTYTDFLIKGLSKLGAETKVIPQQEYRVALSLRTPQSKIAQIKVAAGELSNADLAHIQHEFGLIGHWKDPFDQTLKTLIRDIQIPTVITMHSFHPWMMEMDPTRPHPPFRAFKRLIRFLIAHTPQARYTFGRIFDEADRVIVHTDFARQHLVELGVDAGKIKVIPHGVVRYPSGSAEKFYQRHQIKPEQKLLTIFGFIDSSKGYELALQALLKLPPEYLLVIAGGTRLVEQEAYLGQIKELINRLDLRERVIVTGFLPADELPDLMAATYIMLVPQVYANTSGSLHHGLGSHKVIVASDLEFAKEINTRVPCLRIFRRGDVAELTTALLDLIRHPEKIRALERSAAAYTNKYNWDEIAKRHLAIYQSLFQENRKPT